MAKPISFPDTPTEIAHGEAPRIINRGTVATALRWQSWHDGWRNTVRSLRFYGACIVCGRNCWAFDDGENDPRGVLGDNALWTSTPDDGNEDDEIRTCAICANDYDAYKAAQTIARRQGIDTVRPLRWPGR